MREMKDSKVKWLGVIPLEWKVERVKHGFIRKKAEAHQDNPIVLSLARTGVRERDISNNEGQIAESYYNYNPVDVDDLLINPMDLYSGANCSISKISGVISPAYVNLRYREGYNPQYYDYYFKLQYWLMAFFAHGKGVSYENRWTLNAETLMNYPIIVPTECEQRKIVDYLDAKCSKIDEIIERQQVIIEKLKEYKLSYINEVTNVNDGIKCHLGFIGQMKNGFNFTDTSEGHKIKFLGVGDFKDNFFVDKEEMFSTIISEENVAEDYMLHSGDIVFVRSNGSKELVGRAVMVNGIEYPVTYSGFCIRFRSIRPDIIDSKFLLYYFRSLDFRKQLEKYSQGSNISNLNQDLLSSLQFTIPSKDYQKRMLDEMEIKCKEIDNVVIKFEGMNNKLQEYKKSLIYEVVTGKKEV